MITEMVTDIIKFKDGTYFNGVKGKVLRKTKSFKDAKVLHGELSDRDKRYLEDKEYKRITVIITLEEIT